MLAGIDTIVPTNACSIDRWRSAMTVGSTSSALILRIAISSCTAS
jgi:hypothetical protein